MGALRPQTLKAPHLCSLVLYFVDCQLLNAFEAFRIYKHRAALQPSKWKGYAQFKETAHERGGSHADFLARLCKTGRWGHMYDRWPLSMSTSHTHSSRRTTVSRSVSPTPEAVVSAPPLSPTPPVLSGVQRGDQERDPPATPTSTRRRYAAVPLSEVESSLQKMPCRKLFEWFSSQQRAAQVVRCVDMCECHDLFLLCRHRACACMRVAVDADCCCARVRCRLNGYHERVEKFRDDGVTKRRYNCARCVKCTSAVVNGKKKNVQTRFAPKQGGTYVICKRCKVPLCKKCWPVWHGVYKLTRPTPSAQGSA